MYPPAMAFPPMLTNEKWDTLTPKEQTDYIDWRRSSRQYLRAGYTNQNDWASFPDGLPRTAAAPNPKAPSPPNP